MKLVSKIYEKKCTPCCVEGICGGVYVPPETYSEFVERVTEEVQEFISESGLSLISLSFMERAAVAVFKE